MKDTKVVGIFYKLILLEWRDMIQTVYEDGYSWVEIPDELWKNAEFFTYFNGVDCT
jgi:hypothetical protein